jgi:uncharacterized protein YecT (DUF1311 family)
MLTIRLAASLALCLLTSLHPQKRAAQDPCANAQTTAEMRDCAGQEYQKADAALNKGYRELMAKLDDDGQKSVLKAAQQAWIKYRDANCEFAAYQNRGGTIYPVVYTGCLTSMTTARTKELLQTLKDN